MAKYYYHLVPVEQWRACCAEGKAYFPTTYEQDGFTHLSDNKEVLLTIGNHFYKQIKGKDKYRHKIANTLHPVHFYSPFVLTLVYSIFAGAYIVLEIESSKLANEVKLEPAAPVGDTKPHFDGNEQLFPHLYGSINVDSVVKELKVLRNEEDGSFLELQD